MLGRTPRAVGAMNERGDRWTKNAQIWIPEIEAGHRVRVKQLARELDLKDAGAADGRQRQPATGDTTLNETQLGVCNRVFAGILMLNQFLAEQLGQALAAARHQAPARINQKDYRSRIVHEVDAVFAERIAGLVRLREAELDMLRNLRYFVSRNKLKVAASYPDSPLMAAAVIFGLFVAESIANGLLFKDVVTTGLVGGATIAGLISIINIALGIAAGFVGWRFLRHAGWVQRILGASVTLICHAAALVWNLYVAHFREVAEAAVRSETYEFDLLNLADRTSAHIHSAGWLGVNSLIALALLGLGLIVHFVAAWEGWEKFSDLYPGYKRVDQRAKLARADYEAELVGMRQDARDATADVIAEAEEEHRAAARALRTIANLEGLALQRKKEVRDSEDEWVAGGTQLLKMYRDENVLVRGDECPPPRYFTRFPGAPDYRQRRYDGTGRDTSVDEHAEAAERALAELTALRARSEADVATNEVTLAALRDYANEVLDTLNARVDAARERANQAAAEAGNGALG